MEAIITNPGAFIAAGSHKATAELAYKFADAMMAERER
jgi:hypothetical protein